MSHKTGPKQLRRHLKTTAVSSLHLPQTSTTESLEAKHEKQNTLQENGVKNSFIDSYPNNICHRRCVICGIDSSDFPYQKFFKFPEHPVISNKWAKVCGKKWIECASFYNRASNCSVCSTHFSDSDYTNAERIQLKPGVVPKPLLIYPMDSSLPNNQSEQIEQKSPINHTKSKLCFVSGCKYEFGSSDKEKFCLFLPPRDDTLFERWKRVIPSSEREFTKESLICELHFHKKEIERFCITKSDNGQILKLEKIIPILKSGSIPCIFPDVSANSANTAEDQEQVVQFPITIKREPVDYISVNKNIAGNSNDDVPVEDKYFLYQKLLENIALVKIPNDRWSVISNVKLILFARWNDAYLPVKRVVIENTLTAKVFLRALEVNITGHMEFCSVDDISNLLEKVEDYEFCTDA